MLPHKHRSFRKMLAGLLSGWLILLALPAPAQSPGTSAAPALLTGSALVDALRRGGHVIYFRHAATDWNSDDHVAEHGDWRDCTPARMRQLSDTGRATARRIGDAMRALDVPVGRVLSSEYCRAAETARLLAVGTVQTTLQLMNLRADAFVGGRDAAVANARKLIGEVPGPGVNTVLVAHGNLARAATGAYPGEGGAAVFRPLGESRFELVAMLTPEDWESLAKSFRRQR